MHCTSHEVGFGCNHDKFIQSSRKKTVCGHGQDRFVNVILEEYGRSLLIAFTFFLFMYS